MNQNNLVRLLVTCAMAGCQLASGAVELTASESPKKIGKLQQDTGGRSSSNPLVTADWLANEIETNPKLKIIDLPLRKTNYKTGHIPGAVYVDWRTEIVSAKQHEYYSLPENERMEKLLSRIGATPASTIVLTDNMGNRAAVRMFYTLKYFGHQDVRILNGGTEIWKASNRKLTTAIPEVQSSSYQVVATHDEYVSALDAVQAAIEDHDCQLLDGRPTDQYSGVGDGKAIHSNKMHNRRGHVPSAVSIPWMENLNEDGTFKSISELKELYQSHGIDTDGRIITYCNEGLHAAMPWFVIRELFGNSSVTVYDNSMAEWANREDTPLTKSSGRNQ